MTIKTDSYVIGSNVDDTRNFLLDTDLAGALRIRRKSDGSGGLLATFDSAGNLQLGASASANAGRMVLAAVQNTTSGAAVNFASIPSWVKQFAVNVVGVQASSTASPTIQLGAAGGLESAGYLGSNNVIVGTSAGGINISSSVPFDYTTGAAANIWHGSIVFKLVDPATFKWAFSGILSLSNAQRTQFIAGSKTLAGVLTQLQVSVAAGLYTAGAINVLYEG